MVDLFNLFYLIFGFYKLSVIIVIEDGNLVVVESVIGVVKVFKYEY